MKYRIGIVGGGGFIGFSLANHFSSKFNVKIVDIKKPGNLPANAKFLQCDIRKYGEVERSLKDVDLVIHTAIIQIPLINENKRLAYEVNLLGTTNICKAVEHCPRIKGMILSGTWHTIGERELAGVIDEEFGFRPDKVENRARLYALSKMAQEAIVRFHSEMSDKIYGVIRMGTVLGEGMPKKTAANLFIGKGLRGEPITPFKNSMYRPMLYVDINDICKAYEKFAKKILDGKLEKTANSLSHIVNVYYTTPITILELAQIVRDTVTKLTNGKIRPSIKIVDNGLPMLFQEEDKYRLKIDLTKAKQLLDLERLDSPADSIQRIVRSELFPEFSAQVLEKFEV